MRGECAALFLVMAAAAPANAEDDLTRYITDKAVTCWSKPGALRGIRFSANIDARFSSDGHVISTRIVKVMPDTGTFHVLAGEFANSLRRCGPYFNEGMSSIPIRLNWPR